MMKKRHVLHLAMGVVMTPLLGSCAADEIVGGAGSGNGVLSFGVEVNAGAPEVKPMGGATRSVDKPDSSAVMSPDVESFFPTSSIELSSVDGKTLYANCDERSGINMHNNVDYQITRGTIQTNGNFYSSFALYGYVYVYDSDQKWSSVGKSTSVDKNINGIEMKKGTGNDYNASGVYWPGGSKNATFFAVAPKDCSGVTISADKGGPKITYTVPQTVYDQEDLLVAVAKDVKCDGKNAPNPLTFNHALAAIKFEKGDNLGDFTSISNVEISGVNNKGTLSSFDNLEWTDQSIDGSGTNTYTISDLSNVLFLMPQTFPDEAEIKVTFSNGSNSQEFTAKLKDDTNTTWEAGHQYTYKLSVNKVTGTFKFEVTPSSSFVAITGGKATFTVRSYFQYQDNTIADIPWSGSYKIGETTKTVTGVGGDTGEEINIDIDKNESIINHTETLRANQSKGTAQNPWNLSNSQGEAEVENTANCYVVNSKGTYSIPLVYGCAIKNGTKNSLAYGVGTYNSTTLNTTTFKTHKDEYYISDPYIYKNPSSGTKYNPSYAELLWQDWRGLISSVTYNSNTKMIEFEIGEGIHQGNAIIAIKDADNVVLWSWHIWVTDRDIYATVPIQTVAVSGTTQHTYNFMPVPLGWVDLSEGGVSSRTFTVTLIQPQSNKTLTATANQAGQSALSGTCPYYQWGRKDALCPSDGTTSNVDKTLYDKSGNTVAFNIESGVVSTGTSIQNPTTYYYSSDSWDWNSTTYYDYWNATNGETKTWNDNEVVKTVYDPNPVGFKMPSPDAFTGFTIDGSDKRINSSSCNVESSTINNGYKFYTQGWKKGPTDFWRANGLLYRGSLGGVGKCGDYWSAGPYSDSTGRSLDFYDTYVYPQNFSERASGFSVRPVSE